MKKAKITKKLPACPAAHEAVAAAWVRSMQDHFQQTGYYRADDLNRLLGDPRETVAMSVDHRVQVHSLAVK